jgi:hypothetical protein
VAEVADVAVSVEAVDAVESVTVVTAGEGVTALPVFAQTAAPEPVAPNTGAPETAAGFVANFATDQTADDRDDRDRTGELPVIEVDHPINDATTRLAADLPGPTHVVGVFDVEAGDDEHGEYGPGPGDAQFEAKLDRWVSGGR